MKKKQPNIRFKGKESEIVSKKLKDYFEFIPGITGKIHEDKNGNALLVKRVIVHSKNIIDQTDDLIKADLSGERGRLKQGDVLFTSSGNKNDVATASVVDLDVDNLYYGNFLFAFRPKQQFNSYYLANTLNFETFRNQVIRKGRASSSFVNIKKNDLMNCKILVTDIDTQNKIGEKFKLLDESIKLRKKYGKELKQSKKSAMQNLLI